MDFASMAICASCFEFAANRISVSNKLPCIALFSSMYYCINDVRRFMFTILSVVFMECWMVYLCNDCATTIQLYSTLRNFKGSTNVFWYWHNSVTANKRNLKRNRQKGQRICKGYQRNSVKSGFVEAGFICILYSI